MSKNPLPAMSRAFVTVCNRVSRQARRSYTVEFAFETLAEAQQAHSEWVHWRNEQVIRPDRSGTHLEGSKYAALRIEELLKPESGDRRTFHAGAYWKLPALWRKTNGGSFLLRKLMEQVDA